MYGLIWIKSPVLYLTELTARRSIYLASGRQVQEQSEDDPRLICENVQRRILRPSNREPDR